MDVSFSVVYGFLAARVVGSSFAPSSSSSLPRPPSRCAYVSQCSFESFYFVPIIMLRFRTTLILLYVFPFVRRVVLSLCLLFVLRHVIIMRVILSLCFLLLLVACVRLFKLLVLRLFKDFGVRFAQIIFTQTRILVFCTEAGLWQPHRLLIQPPWCFQPVVTLFIVCLVWPISLCCQIG